MRKKLLAVAVSVMMVVGLCACDDGDAANTTTADSAYEQLGTDAVTMDQYNTLKSIQTEYSALVNEVNELAAQVELDDNSANIIASMNADIEAVNTYVEYPSVLEGEDVDSIIALLQQSMGGAQSVIDQLKSALGM